MKVERKERRNERKKIKKWNKDEWKRRNYN